MPSDADAFVVGGGPHGSSGRRDARRRGLRVLVIEGAATSGGAAERRAHALRHLARCRLGSPPVSGGLAAPPAFSLGARGPVRIPGAGVRAPVGWGRAAAVTRSVAGTAARSAVTRGSYRRLIQPLAAGGTAVTDLLRARCVGRRAATFPGWRCWPGTGCGRPPAGRDGSAPRGAGAGRRRRRARDDAAERPAGRWGRPEAGVRIRVRRRADHLSGRGSDSQPDSRDMRTNRLGARQAADSAALGDMQAECRRYMAKGPELSIRGFLCIMPPALS